MDHLRSGKKGETRISTDLYRDACNDSLLLWFLRREGVERWEGYERALKKYFEYLEEDDNNVRD